MAAISTIVAGAALAVGAGSAYSSYKQGKKAQKASDKQADLARAQSNSAAVTQSRQAVRKGRIARARAMQGGLNSGVAGGSMVSGLSSDALTQTGGQLGDISGANQIQLGNIRAGQQQSAAKTRQANFNSLTSLAGSVFGAAGGFGSLQAGYDRAMGNSDPSSVNTVQEIKAGQHDKSIFK